MDFVLNEKQQAARERFRDFAQKKIKTLAHEIDEQERFPGETVKNIGDFGWLGLPFKKEYGGQGEDSLTYILCIEELSKVCASTGVIVSTHTSLCADTIYQHGTEQQKIQYLKPLAKGKKLGAFALTERESGTDLSGLKTQVVIKEDSYILNGKKFFITNAGPADIYIVFAETLPSAGTKGISAFIVEKNTPGFQVGKLIPKMGIRGSETRELIFNDCVVPKKNLIGEINKGYKIAMRTLDGGRIGIAAQALGIAEGAFENTVIYTKERCQFGRRIADFQNTQFELASMKTEIEAARFLVYCAADAKDKQKRFAKEAAMAKLFASETAMDVTTRCVQLYGGNGYVRGNLVERMMRDAKITQIYEGTSEVQKMVIAAHELSPN